MAKVTLYGLSRSGKTCYLAAMSQSLSKGIDLGGGRFFSATCYDPFQQAQLNMGMAKLENGIWPDGTGDSSDYDFDLDYCLKNIGNITMKDYRGGLLDSVNTLDIDARKALTTEFYGSEVLLFFIGADAIIDAMGNIPEGMRNLSFINTLHSNYRRYNVNYEHVPVMIVITKADIFDSENVNKETAKKFVVEQLSALFGKNTNMTVGITMVSLGRNLGRRSADDSKEINPGGQVDLRGESGNLHIPMMFCAYHFFWQEIVKVKGSLEKNNEEVENARYRLEEELRRSSFARFFSNHESAIRDILERYQNCAKEDRQRRDNLVATFNKIEEFLKRDADIYVNGVKNDKVKLD